MKTEKEIRETIKKVKVFQAEAKENMDKERFHTWQVILNYLESLVK